jgi:hypothetical protein
MDTIIFFLFIFFLSYLLAYPYKRKEPERKFEFEKIEEPASEIEVEEPSEIEFEKIPEEPERVVVAALDFDRIKNGGHLESLYDLVMSSATLFEGDVGVRAAEYLAWRLPCNRKISEMYFYLSKIANGKSVPYKIRSAAVDALIRSNNPTISATAQASLRNLRQAQRTTGEAAEVRFLVERVRDLDANAQNAAARLLQARQALNDIAMNRTRPITVYSDRQNVHNSAINKSVNSSMHNLVYNDALSAETSVSVSDILPSETSVSVSDALPSETSVQDLGYEVEAEVLHGVEGDAKFKIVSSIERISADDAKFSGGITPSVYYKNLKTYIGKSPDRSELIHRLRQELTEMDGSCSTGVVARLVNVLQGFESTPESLKIKMDPLDEIRASLTARLNHAAQANVAIIDKIASSDPADRADFLDFVTVETKRLLPLLSKEYSHISPDVLKTGVTKTIESYVDNKSDAADIIEYISTEISFF